MRALADLDEVKKTDQVARQAEIEQSLALLAQQRLVFDVQRRMNVTMDPTRFLTPPATTLREKLETLFVSRGLLASIAAAPVW